MNCMEGVSRRLSLLDQMSILDKSKLRDLLRVRDEEEEDNGGNSLLTGLTLEAVLGCEDDIINNNRFQRQQPSRTLLDIIKDEESGTGYRGINIDHNNNNNNNNKQKNWKSFKDRIRLGRAGTAWLSSSSSNHPVSDDYCRINISRPNRTGIRRSFLSMISGTSVSTTIPVQNVSENDILPISEREDRVTDSSEPVVMRLSAALAAERLSTETQLEEERESTTHHPITEERESNNLPVNVAEEEERRGNQRNSNEEIYGNERGDVVSSDQPLRVSLMALLEETMDHNNRQSEMSMEMEEEEEGDEEEVMKNVERERERGGGSIE